MFETQNYILKDIIFAGVVLSLALGFGLGLKGKAEDFLGKIFKK